MSKSSLYYYKKPSESLLLQYFREAAEHYPPIKPEGYARKRSSKPTNRVLNALWSDQHYGSDLTHEEHLRAYSNIEETRATAKVLSNILDYKRDKRDETSLILNFNGDDFAGLLGHDDNLAAPLTFQILRAAHIEAQVVAHSAAQFGRVTVNRQWGNHGRNLLRHKGRADNAKWDSFELILDALVRGLCRELKNVTWNTSRRPITIQNVLGWRMLLTHGDTVLSAKPGSQAFEKQVSSINESPYYGGKSFDIIALGHWHSGQQFSVNHTEVFVNPALIPPDGFSESSNYLTACGQFMWETTEKYAVGDIRKVRVAIEDYKDSSLDGLVLPWNETLYFQAVDER